MVTNNLLRQYPHLFREIIWPWGLARAQFILLDDAPANEKIANVNLVPYIDNDWVMLKLLNGSWEIPGGTLEPNVRYVDTINRELLEEVGARLVSSQIIGAWDCYSISEKPYRPHLPHPNYYRLVVVAQIKIMQMPENPRGGEQVIAVERVPIDIVIKRFTLQDRLELAELYLLVSRMVYG